MFSSSFPVSDCYFSFVSRVCEIGEMQWNIQMETKLIFNVFHSLQVSFNSELRGIWIGNEYGIELTTYFINN